MLRHHQAVAASLAAVLADATASQAAAKPAGERQWGRMQALGNGLTVSASLHLLLVQSLPCMQPVDFCRFSNQNFRRAGHS